MTAGLLSAIAENIDIVEPVAKFTKALQGKPGVRSIINVGLEEWTPAEGVKYDLIWTQWCLGHLTDAQMVRYFQTCKVALVAETGIIVIKENLSTSGKDEFDPLDSCVTRFVLLLPQSCGVPTRLTKLQTRRNLEKTIPRGWPEAG